MGEGFTQNEILSGLYRNGLLYCYGVELLGGLVSEALYEIEIKTVQQQLFKGAIGARKQGCSLSLLCCRSMLLEKKDTRDALDQ